MGRVIACAQFQVSRKLKKTKFCELAAMQNERTKNLWRVEMALASVDFGPCTRLLFLFECDRIYHRHCTSHVHARALNLRDITVTPLSGEADFECVQCINTFSLSLLLDVIELNTPV